MANRSYGLQRPVFTNYAAHIRYPDGSSCEDTANASSRKTAFAMIARKHQGGKIVSFKSQAELSTYEQERYGFVQPQHVPVRRVDLDLW